MFYSSTPSLTAKSSFFYVQAVGHFLCDEKYITRRQGYNSYLLIYTINGKGRVCYNGHQYDVDSGKAILINCNDYHEYYTVCRELWEFKWIHFNGGQSDEYFRLIYNNYSPVVAVSDYESIPRHIDTIIDLIQLANLQAEVKTSCIILQILTEIVLEASSCSAKLNKSRHHELVESAIEFVGRNYHKQISIKDMADFVHCSVYYFCRIFKRSIGYSPYEYVVKYRIYKAKEMLKTGRGSIEEVAEGVGFESLSNFVKTFRKFEGITPLKYKKYWLD